MIRPRSRRQSSRVQVTGKGFPRVSSRFRRFRPLSVVEPVPESSQQAGYMDKLNRATGRHGKTMSGDVQAAATDLPGALGRDEVPGGEALAGPGDGDLLMIYHDRYTKSF
jgi:hypothetical protein